MSVDLGELVSDKLKPLIAIYQERIDERYYFPPKYRELSGLQPVGIFDPFLSSQTVATGRLWPRNKELARFQEHVAENEKVHTILTGSSGTGKSLFLNQIVRPLYPDGFVLIKVYNKFLAHLISHIPCPDNMLDERTDLARAILASVESAKLRSVNEVLRDAEKEKPSDPVLAALLDDATAFIQRALTGKTMTLFVFDQIERFLADVKYAAVHTRKHASANEIYCLVRILKALRELPNARTIFAIRQDTLFESIDFLSYSLDASDQADRVFRYMYFSGITTENGEAIKLIQAQFESTKRALEWDTISRFLSLQSRSVANTFLIQLTGYMIEHFGASKEVRRIVREGEPRELLPVFFDHLIAGFHKRYPGTVSYNILRTVMLTIAIENRNTGDPISDNRTAGLAHLPPDYVETVVRYLKEINVVHADEAGDDEAVRYAHDMVFDHIVESDRFTVRDDLHKAIERLSDRRTQRLRKVDKFGRVWWDTYSARDIGALAVVAFIVYGALVSISSWNLSPWDVHTGGVCEILHSFWSRRWAGIAFVDNCESMRSMRWYYPIVYVMDSFWVSYIYKLDRGYLCYVFKGERVAGFFSKMMPVIGALLGIAMSFTPTLTIVPLATVGFIMSGLLFYAWYRHGKESAFAEGNRLWAQRTLFNMVFTVSLMVLHYFVITDEPTYAQARDTMDKQLQQWLPLPFVTAKNVAFWVTSGLMIWFLFHIRPEQQSEESHAARLANLDVAARRHGTAEPA